jgi:hypothetical protein
MASSTCPTESFSCGTFTLFSHMGVFFLGCQVLRVGTAV